MVDAGLGGGRPIDPRDDGDATRRDALRSLPAGLVVAAGALLVVSGVLLVVLAVRTL